MQYRLISLSLSLARPPPSAPPLPLPNIRANTCDWPLRLRRRRLIGERYGDRYVCLGEVASASIHRTLEPILVHFADQLDHVILLQEGFPD